MDYKYPPVYKYIILLILITSFLKYYKVITKDNYMIIGVIFTYMSFVFDFILIENHPSLFSAQELQQKAIIGNTKNSSKSKKNKKKIKLVGETNQKIEHFEDSEKSTCSKPQKHISNNNTNTNTNTDTDSNSDNLTEEIQKELDELDLD